jgi:hypothetical protein
MVSVAATSVTATKPSFAPTVRRLTIRTAGMTSNGSNNASSPRLSMATAHTTPVPAAVFHVGSRIKRYVSKNTAAVASAVNDSASRRPSFIHRFG